MANKMLIDATHPEETRVVVLRGNRVEEFDFETAHRKQLRGNIYLAKVTRVEPSLQAAFVEYGGNRHGFLAFSEIHPDYYQIPVADRQALIEADARATRDEEEAEEHPRGNRRHRGRSRHRDRAHSRRDESVHSGPVATDDTTAAQGDTIEGAPQSFDASSGEFQGPDETGGRGETHDASASDPSSTGIAASEMPLEAAPLSANEIHDAADNSSDDHVSGPESGASAAGHDHDNVERDHAEHDDAEHPAESHASTEDGEHHATEHDGGDADHSHDHGAEHGHDEEEEVVESVGGSDAMEEVAERAPRYRRQYKIQEVIKRRQVMLVQVVKEERGTKGAALTTYLSLAGRYCVLMPNTARGGGISRKITSAEDRKKLREIAEDLEVPEGMGVILRTAGAARTKQEVKRDFEYLLRTWEQIRDLTLRSTAPTLVHEEGSLAKRSIRDLYTKDIDEIVVAGEQGYKEAKEFMRTLMPSHARNVKLYRDPQPVYTRYGIESQLDAMFSPTVQLRSGGYIVINQTEALVAIDVNSGRSTREHHIEDTALKTNCEAAEEVARQLRLRDLAGLIVIDFIDMDEKRNNRTVERRLKDALRNDRARIQVGRISHFGLMEMSRQRIRTSVLESSTEQCPHCGGTGHIRSVSSVALQLLRSLEEMLLKGPTHNLVVRTRTEIALYVLNHKRAHLRGLEERFHITLTVSADGDVGGQIGFTIDRGEQVMTVEQAKALLAQVAEAAPGLVEEDEPDMGDAFDDEAEADGEAGDRDRVTYSDIEEINDDAEDSQPLPSEGGPANGHENGRESGRDGDGGPRRRRRRRRGRGGRNGEGRDGGAPQPHPEHGEFAAENPQSFAQPNTNAAVAGSDEQDVARNSERGEFEDRGDGEPRRKRRGRRGGRRSRRDAGEQNEGFAASRGQEASSEDGSPSETHERPDFNERPDASPAAMQPRDERPPFEAAPASQAAAEPPPRRRSTVREAAPVSGGDSMPAVSAPTPQPAHAPVAADEAEAAKPKRSGWWAKKLLGG